MWLVSSQENRRKVFQVQAQIGVDPGGVKGGSHTGKVEARQVVRLDQHGDAFVAMTTSVVMMGHRSQRPSSTIPTAP